MFQHQKAGAPEHANRAATRKVAFFGVPRPKLLPAEAPAPAYDLKKPSQRAALLCQVVDSRLCSYGNGCSKQKHIRFILHSKARFSSLFLSFILLGTSQKRKLAWLLIAHGRANARSSRDVTAFICRRKPIKIKKKSTKKKKLGRLSFSRANGQPNQRLMTRTCAVLSSESYTPEPCHVKRKRRDCTPSFQTSMTLLNGKYRSINTQCDELWTGMKIGVASSCSALSTDAVPCPILGADGQEGPALNFPGDQRASTRSTLTGVAAIRFAIHPAL